MIHPSYVDLMKVVNKDVEEGETPVINSRYSIVMATAKRARQIVDGDEPLIDAEPGEKPLSIAVEELNKGQIRILAEDEREEDILQEEEDARLVEEILEEEEVSDEPDTVEESAETEKDTETDNDMDAEQSTEGPAQE